MRSDDRPAVPCRFPTRRRALAFVGAASATGLAAIATTPAARAGEGPVCDALEIGPVRAVTRILDSETIALDDGSEVRLVNALAPRPPDLAADAEAVAAWEPATAARAALEALVAGRSVALLFSGRRTDRYGRLLAHVRLADSPGAGSVQERLVAAGHARVYALPGSTACIARLLALESEARAARRASWAHAAYQIRDAAAPRELIRFRDTFQLVEGVARRVTDVRGHLYVNFGADWRTDFTAHLAPPVRRGLVVSPGAADLDGRRVRVRGWIEWRNGPFIDLHDAALLERVDG